MHYNIFFLFQSPSVGSRLFLGFLAGSLASIANIPFDVAKSRIQVDTLYSVFLVMYIEPDLPVVL